MIYLLDANTLIDANRDYYSIDRVPEFWDWLQYLGSNNSVKVPIEIYEEIKAGSDALASWAKEEGIQTALLLDGDGDADADIVSDVVNKGYAADLTDVDIDKIGRDPFIIAHALNSTDKCCVVTTEVSKPSAQRSNKKLPDVCNIFGIRCIHTFEFIRELNFNTNWKNS